MDVANNSTHGTADICNSRQVYHDGKPKELYFGEAEEIGGRRWHPVKTHTIALAVESNTPSHSVYE